MDGGVAGRSGLGTPRDAIDDGAGVGELHTIDVDPAHWSRGLGSFLFSRPIPDLAGVGSDRAYPWGPTATRGP